MSKIFTTVIRIFSQIFLFRWLFAIIRIPTSFLLIIVNIIPLIGVIFLGWNPFDLVLLYWFENVVIGVYTLLRLLIAKGETGSRLTVTASGQELAHPFGHPLGLAGFFSMHYGIFTLVHGIFIFAFFGSSTSLFNLNGLIVLLTFLVGITTSHGISFLYNFLYKGEYKVYSPWHYFASPYGRIIPIHLTIIFGAMIEASFPNTPALITFLFVGIKIAIDLYGHIKAHSQVN
jgi:hypothetical protein